MCGGEIPAAMPVLPVAADAFALPCAQAPIDLMSNDDLLALFNADQSIADLKTPFAGSLTDQLSMDDLSMVDELSSMPPSVLETAPFDTSYDVAAAAAAAAAALQPPAPMANDLAAAAVSPSSLETVYDPLASLAQMPVVESPVATEAHSEAPSAKRSAAAAELEGEDEATKRARRLERNRIAAQQSRLRKKAYQQSLEEQLKELEESNSSMEMRLSRLDSENSLLSSQLDELRVMIERATAGDL